MVASNALADPAPSPSEASGTSDPSPNDTPTREVIAAFLAVAAPLLAQLQGALQTIPPAQSKHHANVGPKQLQVIPMATAMIRTTPDLSGVTADTIEGIMADAEACSDLSGQFKSLAMALDHTNRLRLELGWQVASGAIATGRKRAPLSAAVARDVADIDAVMARGPRDLEAAHTVVTIQAQADKANERAVRANEKLAAATARAEVFQKGTGDATATEPTEPTGSTPVR